MIKSFIIMASLFVPTVVFAQSLSIATVPVGNPGNPNDSNTGNLYGGVPYNYSIGKYDVTVGQYTAFLNAVAATDTNDLYNSSMATDLNVAGISRSGSSGSYTYTVIGSPNHPVTYVSWGDTVRFANWLYNGQPTGSQGVGTTETGSYTLNGATTDTGLNAVTRNVNATWVIPTESEWYKAAYYNPGTNSYYMYPYSSSTPPTSAVGGSTPNTGNFYDPTTGYAVGSTPYNISLNYLTDVGAFTGSASPYGAYDMGGDVFQWNETLISGSLRGLRGGAWSFSSLLLASSYRFKDFPSFERFDFGFRVALVPEPSTLALLTLGGVIAFAAKRRR